MPLGNILEGPSQLTARNEINTCVAFVDFWRLFDAGKEI